ncbi:CBS domain-containing protein [Deinococcus geothermalis DSM 11300]|uniref:CBS domain-containing protein n=1 Tax=Deinococcus geothermalis (strain DSM 11300 / CIP 105573 / AG-3a) TaxID=319795 RepID=Q1J2G5_DEIGD|nr:MULTISPECIES: CBS domain-containing protein [Deinococcus]ABF44319.1 CBS domain-containing protein [Deinococcus geothermalis DSM 11300]MBI0445172.1 CBS domain-containing protein [Deinococcus sp. DB0503]
MNLAALMTPSPVAVTPGHSLSVLDEDRLFGGVITTPPDRNTCEAAHTLLHHRSGGMPVVDDGGKVNGMLTVTDRLVRGQAEDAAQESRR